MGTEVWLRSYEIPGVPGTGTEGNPFDASRADIFDALLRDFYFNPHDPIDRKYYIHLGPGSFKTNGNLLTPSGGVTTGWKMGNGWILEGMGMNRTTLKLNEFTDASSLDANGTHGSRVVVFAVPGEPNNNLVVRDMTIDANWPALPNRPADGKCAVAGVAMYSRGNATVENVRCLNTYGDNRSALECFSIFLSHVGGFDETRPLGPPGIDPAPPALPRRATLAIRNCIAEDGHGDYVVGMTCFSRHMVDMRHNLCRNLPNGFPPGVYPTHPNGANPSSAYQFTGRGITFTHNQSQGCPCGLYFDTGNIDDVLIAQNQFFGCGWGGLATNPINNFFGLNVRKTKQDLDGAYFDLPIKLSGASNDYRVRVWLKLKDSTATPPPIPNPGCRFEVEYQMGDDTHAINLRIVDKLRRYSLEPEPPDRLSPTLFAAMHAYNEEVIGTPTTTNDAEDWAGDAVVVVSDPTALYGQRNWRFQNWVIDHNVFGIDYGYWTVARPTLQRWGVLLAGSGQPECRDYTVTNNVVQFYGPIIGGQNSSYVTGRLAGHLSFIGNQTNYSGVSGASFGQALIQLFPGSTFYSFGNRINSGPSFGSPIPGLEDTPDSVGTPAVGTLGAITEAGALLVNTTPATLDLEQASPAVWWSGQGWATTPASSQPLTFRSYILPAEGDDNPSGRWVLESSINDGAFGHQPNAGSPNWRPKRTGSTRNAPRKSPQSKRKKPTSRIHKGCCGRVWRGKTGATSLSDQSWAENIVLIS